MLGRIVVQTQIEIPTLRKDELEKCFLNHQTQAGVFSVFCFFVMVLSISTT